MVFAYQNTPPKRIASIYNIFPSGSYAGKVTESFIKMVDRHVEGRGNFETQNSRKWANHLLSLELGERSAEAHSFVAQQIRHGIKHAKNKIPYVELLNDVAGRLKITTFDKQGLMSMLVGWRVYANPQVFDKLTDYQLENENEVLRDREIFKKCLSHSREKNGGKRMQLYIPFLEHCVRNAKALELSPSDRLEMLTEMHRHGLKCSRNAYLYFSAVPANETSLKKQQQQVTSIMKEDSSNYLSEAELRNIGHTLEGFCYANPAMDMTTFKSYAGIYLDLLQSPECPPDISIAPLKKLMERRADLNPAQFSADLFSAQPLQAESVNKEMFSEFLHLAIDKTKANGGIKNTRPRMLNAATAMMKAVMSEHSFSKKEMLQTAKAIKTRNYHSESTEAYFMDFNTELQQIYNHKLDREIVELGKWARAKAKNSEQERLAVRSTYIDLLHERLINDRSVSLIDKEDALAERWGRFQSDAVGNSEKDWLNYNRIVCALEGPYRSKGFVKDIKKTAQTLQSGTAEVISQRLAVRKTSRNS